jgi:tRNA nucleotidyltransferase (CCA-adding enzyme)
VARAEGTPLRPPGAVLDITRDLESAGFQAWCVGGAVRDALLGNPHLDWDLATDATPDQVRTIFGRKRTIPVGIEFGTVGVLDETGVLHEVTTFRRDVKTDGRHAVVEFGASLDEDLSRRDFTINAIAFSPSRNEVRDPFGGRADLEGKLIRAVGEPAERMKEDRLRALRGIRFASRLGFEIDSPTWTAIRESSPHLTRLSHERVKQELEKTMDQVSRPSGALMRWKEAGAIGVLLPELTRSDEAIQAVDHAAQPGVAKKPGRRLLRFATLFSELDEATVLALALRLRFSKHDAQWVAGLAGLWKRLGKEMSVSLARDETTPVAIRRWVAAIGRTRVPAFFRLAEARWAGRRGSGQSPTAQRVHSFYKEALRTSLRDPVDLRDLAVDGDDLRKAGVQPGPELGRLLSKLLEEVLADPKQNTRDALLGSVRRMTEKS